MVRLLLPLLVLTVTGASPPGQPDRPVTVGRIADLDACLSDGKVTGLSAAGDNYLAVRSRPSAGARELDRLHAGRIVAICEVAGGGSWTGIVYASSGADTDCGVGTPRPRRMPYRGPCRSGWVASRWITVIAG